MRNRNSHHRGSRRGVALVELAISLTLLLTIVLGCVDAGRFAYSYISVSNATSEAATFASLHAPGEFGEMEQWTAAVRQRAIDEAPRLNPQIAAADFNVDTSVLSQGLISVSVAYTFETLVPWPHLPQQYPMNRRVILSQTP